MCGCHRSENIRGSQISSSRRTGKNGFRWRRTSGTDAVLGPPTAAAARKLSVSLVLLTYESPRSLTSPILLPQPSLLPSPLAPSHCQTLAPTWRQAHTTAGASLGGTPWVRTTNLAAETCARVASSGENQWSARSDDRPPSAPLVAPGAQLSRTVPSPPPDGKRYQLRPDALLLAFVMTWQNTVAMPCLLREDSCGNLRACAALMEALADYRAVRTQH